MIKHNHTFIIQSNFIVGSFCEEHLLSMLQGSLDCMARHIPKMIKLTVQLLTRMDGGIDNHLCMIYIYLNKALYTEMKIWPIGHKE